MLQLLTVSVQYMTIDEEQLISISVDRAKSPFGFPECRDLGGRGRYH